MQNRNFIILIVLTMAFCGFIMGYKPKDCGSTFGKWTDFRIKECSESTVACALERDYNVTVVIDFVPYENFTSVIVAVRAIIMNINIRLSMKLKFACLFGGLECPLIANQTYKYEQKWNTWSIPRYEMLLKWYLKDETGRNIVCVQIPAVFA